MASALAALRFVVGAFFVATGAFKVLGSVGPGAPKGLRGFAEFLAAAGVPLARVNALVVVTLELGCGAALALSAFRTMPSMQAGAAAVLAFDMLVAVATVGVRTQRGRPVIVRGQPVAAERWRLALELVVLGLLVVVAVTSWRGRALG